MRQFSSLNTSGNPDGDWHTYQWAGTQTLFRVFNENFSALVGFFEISYLKMVSLLRYFKMDFFVHIFFYTSFLNELFFIKYNAL